MMEKAPEEVMEEEKAPEETSEAEAEAEAEEVLGKASVTAKVSVRGKCIKPLALSAERNAKSLSSPWKEKKFSARNALLKKEKDSKKVLSQKLE